MHRKSRTLWPLMRGHRLRYFGAFGAMVVSIPLSYVIPLILGVGVDLVSGETLRGPAWLGRIVASLGGRSFLVTNLWIGCVGIVLFAALSGLFGYVRARWCAQASEAIARGLRDRLYDHLQHLPCTYHDGAPTGDLVQRCTSDVETIRMFLSHQVVEVTRAVVMVAWVLPFMLALSAPMTALAMAMLPLIMVFALVFFSKVKTTFRIHDEAEGKMTTVLQENLSGIRVVRAFARQDFERGKFGQANARYRDTGLDLMNLLSAYWSSSDFLVMVQYGLVLFVGAYWMLTRQVTAGVVVAFLGYESRLLWPVRQMGRVLTDIGQALVSLGRVREILDQPQEPALPTRSVLAARAAELAAAGVPPVTPRGAPQAARGEIRFRDLRFAFGRQPVLSGVTFDVPAGQTVAILGPSGSGKSTLIHVLLRLYDYTEGSVTLDGRELAEMDRHVVRSQVGVVLQEPFLYSKTLRENITIAHAQASDQTIAQAAATACIDESIQSFEQGYDTLVGERGVMLSGGQRQRVALARAVLKDPPILILDDALSAVDTQTEALILSALRHRHGRRTTLIIAHRLSTLMQADRIVVLEHGRVAQIGTHAQLLRQEGLYRRLWTIQSSLEEDLSHELDDGGPDPAGAQENPR
ncbi:MAG: ABC transporter ATP-binding protein/permease [Phycisphaerae bacterium]|nr:ABC transporter ATP-binding protein/permease [Phycisphaerae bacterium]